MASRSNPAASSGPVSTPASRSRVWSMLTGVLPASAVVARPTLAHPRGASGRPRDPADVLSGAGVTDVTRRRFEARPSGPAPTESPACDPGPRLRSAPAARSGLAGLRRDRRTRRAGRGGRHGRRDARPAPQCREPGRPGAASPSPATVGAEADPDVALAATVRAASRTWSTGSTRSSPSTRGPRRCSAPTRAVHADHIALLALAARRRPRRPPPPEPPRSSRRRGCPPPGPVRSGGGPAGAAAQRSRTAERLRRGERRLRPGAGEHGRRCRPAGRAAGLDVAEAAS